MWQHDYSFMDRLLHRLAFASWPIQTALADMEQVTFKARLEPVGIERPVFVAGLPRAGSTLILRMIEATGEFASYQYKDMPFLLCPMTWNAFTKGAKRSVEVRERAHGDGIAVGIESPEAMEEVVWRAFYPKRYEALRIRPWAGKAVNEEFETFFKRQMQKIIAIRQDERPSVTRYLSKGNGNIARLNVIHRMLPDAALIVPYRDPVSQAQSLLTQHLGFLEMHAADKFSREYMAGIGHYDLGASLKPIDFGEWLGGRSRDFTKLDAWLEYWCAAYSALVAQTELPLYFLSYDRLREKPAEVLGELEAMLGAPAGALTGQAGDVRPGDRSAVADPGVDPGLLAEARRIQGLLEARQAAWGGTPKPAAAAKPTRKRA